MFYIVEIKLINKILLEDSNKLKVLKTFKNSNEFLNYLNLN